MSVIISNAPVSSDIPSRIPGLQVWLDAADSNYMTFSASNALSQWRDKSSNAFVFNTVAGTPFLQTDSYKQGIFFNSAISSIMRTTTPVTFTSNVTTIYAVGNQTSSMNTISMMLSYGVQQDCSLRFGNVGTNANDFFYQQVTNYNGSNPAYLPRGPTNYFLTHGILGPVIGGATASSNLQLSSDAGQFGNRFYHGYFNELIIYSNILSASQRSQVEGYLAWKYNLISNFSTTYTYVNSNPSIPVTLNNQYNATRTNDNLNNLLSSRGVEYRWSPSNISGLLVWFDSADNSTLSNSGLATFTWNSKGSVNPLQMTVPAGSNPPTVSNLSGFPGVYFNGSNTRLNAAQTVPSFGATATTWMACATYTSTISALMPDAAEVIGYSNVANSERSIRFNAPTSYTCYAINTGVLRGDIGNNSNGVRGYIDQANYFRSYANGVNTCNNNTAVTYNIGANATLQMAQWNVGNLVGFIHEVCIFNRELSIDEYQKVEGYLCWKYGYNKQLPSSHPNYWFPPN